MSKLSKWFARATEREYLTERGKSRRFKFENFNLESTKLEESLDENPRRIGRKKQSDKIQKLKNKKNKLEITLCFTA